MFTLADNNGEYLYDMPEGIARPSLRPPEPIRPVQPRELPPRASASELQAAHDLAQKLANVPKASGATMMAPSSSQQPPQPEAGLRRSERQHAKPDYKETSIPVAEDSPASALGPGDSEYKPPGTPGATSTISPAKKKHKRPDLSRFPEPFSAPFMHVPISKNQQDAEWHASWKADVSRLDFDSPT